MQPDTTARRLTRARLAAGFPTVRAFRTALPPDPRWAWGVGPFFSGDREPPSDFLQVAADLFGVSYAWLDTGEGDGPPPPPEPTTPGPAKDERKSMKAAIEAAVSKAADAGVGERKDELDAAPSVKTHEVAGLLEHVWALDVADRVLRRLRNELVRRAEPVGAREIENARQNVIALRGWVIRACYSSSVWRQGPQDQDHETEERRREPTAREVARDPQVTLERDAYMARVRSRPPSVVTEWPQGQPRAIRALGLPAQVVRDMRRDAAF